MKEKFKTWLNKPYTRKDVLKCNIAIMIIYIIMMCVYCVWYFADRIKEKLTWVRDEIERIKKCRKLNKIA